MKDNIIIDTNIWVYLYSEIPIDKYSIIENILINNSDTIYISNQILGELYHVLTRKRLKEKDIAKIIIEKIISNFHIIENTTSQVLKAIEFNKRYNYSYWDSLILSSAIENDCSILYSEDMHHNQLIEDKLKIINPFI